MARLELNKGRNIQILVPGDCESGVRRVLTKLAEDILAATGAKCSFETGSRKTAQAILIATAGQGEWYGQLTRQIPGLCSLKGQRETYGFYLVAHPLPEVEQGLVICGSDKLGTIYGLFHLSELLGVTACKFWGDVNCKSYHGAVLFNDKYETEEEILGVNVKNGNSKEPSVKYRGFFINDEWPCFGNWTFSHFGGFTAEMYDKVFEYLLRMKGNYLWPAMWTSSFLLDGPGMESMKLADEYGIYIGMSHHEPCMRSSEEWDLVKGENTPYQTDWDYVTNKEGLLCYWEDGLKRSVGHNVFPTIGMRGERDSMMLGEDSTIEENIRLLKEIIEKQRELISRHLNPNLDQIPQLFAVYKEVEDYYFGDGRTEGLRGFQELDGVTLLLCEDNYSNMRALPEAFERDHPGGFGMYYHLDYHGGPCSYEWVNSTPLSKIWEQMTQAYEYGIRELWIVNVGDVKFQEFPLGYFMELAYDFETWGSNGRNRTEDYTNAWIDTQFKSFTGEEQRRKIAQVLKESVRINGLRRPESLNDQVYHPVHSLETARMLAVCETVETANEELLEQLASKPAGNAYYSMIYYPAAASVNLLKMHLYAGLNHLCGAQGKTVANEYGEKLLACIQRDQELSQRFADFMDGKWRGMERAFHVGFTNWNSEDWRYPLRSVYYPGPAPRLIVSRADQEKTYTNQYFPVPLSVEDFRTPGSRSVVLQVANGGSQKVEWSIAGRSPFFRLSAYEGSTALQDEIVLTAEWSRLPLEEDVKWQFEICAGEETVPVTVHARKRDLSEIPVQTTLEAEGIIAVQPDAFTERQEGYFEGEAARFEYLFDYGKQGCGLKVFPVTASFAKCSEAPSVTYSIWAEQEGSWEMDIHTSPANPLVYGGILNLGYSVNGGTEQILPVVGGNYRGGDHTCKEWADAVLNQEHICRAELSLKRGQNQIRIFGLSAGIVLERMVCYKDSSRRKASYLGPKAGYRIN